MSIRLGSYLHIVDGKKQRINQNHPLEGNYDKTIFIKRFVSHFDNMTYEDISKGQGKLYKITYKGYSYNLFIEAFDGGGRDSTDGAKKISITGIKKFRELIAQGEPVLIINEYAFLESTDDGNYKLSDTSVYGIIKPEEVYNSKTVETENPSSRWVKLEDMINAVENQKMVMNNKNNVYVVPANLLSSYFDLKIIDEQYNEMTKFIFKHETNEKLSEEKIGRIFREKLIKEKGLCCEFCNCKIDVSDQLVASHINSRSNIRNNKELTDEEKVQLMIDVYNGFLLCRVHDSLFDKKHITFTNDGKLIVAPNFKQFSKEYNFEGFEGKKIIDVPEQSIKYLEVHRNDFCKLNNIDDLD